MPHLRLHVKFLGLILGSLVVLLGGFSYIVVERESRLLAKKGIEKQHIFADAILVYLKQSMITGRPRNTLDLMKNLEGSTGLIRLKALRRNGTPAFGITGKRLDMPQLEKVFLTGEESDYPEQGGQPVQTILMPLRNEGECRACHKTNEKVLGAIMVSLSLKDTEQELAGSRRDFTAMLSLLILCIGGILYLLIKKVILSPLITLHRGAELIGSGNLSHRIDLTTNDELQDLAGAFNAMTVQLEASHAGLEHKISERTAQLSSAMAEVEDKAKRLYYHSRDMATISRLSTKIFNAELSLDELLDRFMHGLNRGLGYRRAMVCLVDRKRAWLEVKRDTGIGDIFPFASQSLASNDPLVSLTRAGRPVVLDDFPAGGAAKHGGDGETVALSIVPILRHIPRMCWQTRSCIKADCPAYEEPDIACWLIPDTLCQNVLMESFHDKLVYCMTCEVFPVVGVLVVAADPRKRPSRGRNMSVLRILTADMGAALENHRLHDDKQRMVRELLELHKVTAAALFDLSLDKALEAFADSAQKFSGMDACNFWLVSKDGRELVRKGGGCNVSQDRDFCPERIPADAGLLGRAFSKNAVILEYDAATSDSTALGQALAEHELPSLLAIPLSTEGRPAGVFSVHKRSALPFLESEVATFLLLGNQAALAINVCTLNEELSNHNRELARHTSLMSGILSSMSSGIMLLDRRGSVKLVNHAGAALLQTRPEDLMDRRLADLFPETEVFIRPDIGTYLELELRMPDGSSVPIGYSSAHYQGAGGEREGMIVVFRDLTEIRALQSELLNKERFAAMGRVVAGVAHEIRNPLFGISSIGQIFERELRDPAHIQLAKALLSETRRLNQLVEELLIYGRPIKLKIEQCDLRQLWEEVLEMHEEEAGRRGLTITTDFGIRHPRTYLDAYQIRQVFLNLLRNSIEATPAAGRINIRLLLEDAYLIFIVTDNGAGIPSKNLERVFELFFTTKPRGTGLGLAICKKIVQDHGGDISIDSEQGKGTTVTVKLPYRGITEDAEVQKIK